MTKAPTSRFFIALFMFQSMFMVAQNPTSTLTNRILPIGPGNAEKVIDAGSGSYLVMGKGNTAAYLMRVNKTGTPLLSKNYASAIGGIRSEFTDGVKTGDGFILVGDCDACNAANPSSQARRMLILKTDQNLNVKKLVYLDAPTNISKPYQVFGWQKLRRDGTKLLVASQLLFGEGNGRRTDLAVTQLDTLLNITSHKALDVNPMDNLGDVEIVGSDIFLLTYGIKDLTTFTFGADSIDLLKVNHNVQLVSRRKYAGVGLCMTRLTDGNWVIGGAETKDYVQGPQAMLIKVNGTTGNEMRRTVFGITNSIDQITDVQQLANGNLITSATQKQAYPDINYLLQNYNLLFLNPDSIPYPKSAQINIFNSNFLTAIGQPVILPNLNNSPVVLRMVLPLSNDGQRFISVGYNNNRSLFFARDGITSSTLGAGLQSGDEAMDRDAAEELAINTAVYPNPVQSGEYMNLKLENLKDEDNATVEMFDFFGRLVSRYPINGVESIQVQAPEKRGIYVVRAYVNGSPVATVKLSVQ
ncbi:MAG: T9SS type A sorting domain-containing protein [Bacteroidota bacterium]